jgi:transcriptional regulator with XRE-family HTH domain
MNIGKRIKEERQKRKWTQEQLGEKLNVSRSAVSSWEVGRNYPDLEAIILISDLLEISLDELLREDEEIVKDVTKKLKMNKTYKVLLGIFNIYLTKTEKKYHQNLEKNGWEIYTPNDEPGFNQFTLDEEGVHYYTTILPTGLIGYPLEEQKLKIIVKKDGLAMVIQDKKI